MRCEMTQSLLFLHVLHFYVFASLLLKDFRKPHTAHGTTLDRQSIVTWDTQGECDNGTQLLRSGKTEQCLKGCVPGMSSLDSKQPLRWLSSSTLCTVLSLG